MSDSYIFCFCGVSGFPVQESCLLCGECLACRLLHCCSTLVNWVDLVPEASLDTSSNSTLFGVSIEKQTCHIVVMFVQQLFCAALTADLMYRSL